MKNKGYIQAVLANLIWGFLPLYWQQLSHLTALEILGARILFSALSLILLVHILRNPLYINYFKNKDMLKKLFLSGILIAFNWGTYIYAVSTNQVLQASLGYFIGPLITVLLGVVILKEKLTKGQRVAFVIVAISLVLLIMDYGSASWIAFTVAISFSIYGFLKKKYHLDSLNSMILETLFALPFISLILIFGWTQNATNVLFSTPLQWVFIMLSGVVTFTPLILYAEGAKKIPLNALGFIQYITPTMFLLVGIFINGEPFNQTKLVVFSLLWVGILINFFFQYPLSIAKKG